MFLDFVPGSGPSSKSQVLCDADLTRSGDREASSSPPPHHPGRLSLLPSISSEQPERTHHGRGSPFPRIRGTDPRLWPRTLFLPLFPSLLTQEALAAGSLARETHRHFLSAGPLKYDLASPGSSPCAFPPFLNEPGCLCGHRFPEV